MEYEILARILGEYIRSSTGPYEELKHFHRWLMVMAERSAAQKEVE